LVIIGAGLTAAFWLPPLVREQVAARVEARTGLSAKVDGVSLGFGSVTLGELAVGAEGGPRIRARDVAFDAGPLMLALRGASAVDGLHVRELDVALPLHAPASQKLLERLRARGEQAAQETSEAGDAIEVRIDALALALSDEQGALLQMKGSARAEATGAELAIEKLAVGRVPDHALEVERVTVRAQRGAGGLRIARASAARARLALATPPPPPAGAALPEPEEEELEDDGTAAPPAASPEPPSRPSTWARLLRAVRSATGSGKSTAGAATAQAAAGPPGASTGAAQGGVGAAFRRLSDDAVLALETASVHDGGFDKPAILQSLRATLKVQRARALTLTGSGKAQGGGSIGWDLVLKPEPVAADGQVELRSLPLALLAPFLPEVPWHEPELGRVDASLVIKTESAQAIALSGEASLRDAAIAAARIAATPVHDIGLSLSGKGRFLPLQKRLEIAESRLTIGNASVDLAGAMEWSADHYLFDVDAVLPPTPCTSAVRAIPEDLLGDMALATWAGKLAGKLRLKLDSRELDAAEFDIDVQDRCEFATVPAMADLRRFQTPFLHSVMEPNGGVFEMETGPGTAAWAYLEDISPFFVHAVLAHEDGGFFKHRGFSMMHVRNALVRNLKERRYVVGASTITMQLVKNVFLHREKTLARKIQEVLLTWWIERVMEKRDILELYLNVIEYGPGVYGIRNGARHYFNRLPSQLSPAEAVYLSTILPNPKRYHSHFERGALSSQWMEIMRRMLVRLRERGSYSPEVAEYGLGEVKAFRFVPEGAIVPARLLPAGAAPLPYMQGFEEGGGEGGWDADAGGDPLRFDEARDSLPARTERRAAQPGPAQRGAQPRPAQPGPAPRPALPRAGQPRGALR
jgi:hypothetical protein